MGDREAVDRPLTPGTDLRGDVPVIGAGRNAAAALALRGSITSEHGIGVARRAWLAGTRGEGAVRVMRAVKAALDPLGILSPGRLLPDGE